MWKLAFLVFQLLSFFACSSDDKKPTKRLMRTEKAKRVVRIEKVSSSEEVNVSNAEVRSAGRMHRVRSHFMHKGSEAFLQEHQPTTIAPVLLQEALTGAPTAKPYDCEWLDWTEWDPVDCPACGGGKRTSTRKKNGPFYNGQECANPGGLPEATKYSVCTDSPPCALTCEWSKWSEWSECSTTCHVGMQHRARQKEQERIKDCKGAFEQRRLCGGSGCPIDCVVGEWVSWSGCDQTCGGGKKHRYREKLGAAQFHGKPCPDLMMDFPCNEQLCPNTTIAPVVADKDCSFFEKLKDKLTKKGECQ